MGQRAITFLQALGRLPGLGMFAGMADKMITAKANVDAKVYRARELKGQVADVGSMAGVGGDADEVGDDKTIIRPHPGAGAGDDKTMIRPRPGARGGAQRAAPVPRQPVQIVGSGLNALVDAATALFSLVGQLRGTTSHPNADALRNHAVQQMQAFDTAARNAGSPPEAVLAARYSLCTLIDETVLGTPWGMESLWSRESMLSTFHNETFGGEKFFAMLERAGQEPARNLDLLEFMYLCIALGLEGRYRVQERGRALLEQVQDNLYRTIRHQRGDYERELSPRWRGVEQRGNRLARYVPIWVVAAFAGVLAVAIYLGFSYSLGKTSDPIYAELGAIGRGAPPEPVKAVARTLTLKEVLADDITSGRISVDEYPEGTKILIRGEGLFDSGSANLSQALLPLIRRIGSALDQFPGRILVTGHTDSTPMSARMKLKFPSNWHLSQARADSVIGVVGKEVKDPTRPTAEGRGATEPLASNDTREGRARNRRVEMTLLTVGTAQ